VGWRKRQQRDADSMVDAGDWECRRLETAVGGRETAPGSVSSSGGPHAISACPSIIGVRPARVGSAVWMRHGERTCPGGFEGAR
jgi:hypothetical protein